MSNGLTLLVVEDEPLIQLMLWEMLVDDGYEVCVADDAAQAICLLGKPDRMINGIVTDVRLGTGPDGWLVARHARALTPNLPVVYITGDSGHEWAAHGVAGSKLVQKPFTIAQIKTAVADTLLLQAK